MIKAGKNKKAPFCAYGDDSHFNEVLVYAYAIFHRKNISKAKKALNKIKNRYKIPIDSKLHCRILFSGHQRKKANLEHLTFDSVRDIISNVIETMNKIPCLLRYGYSIVEDPNTYFLKPKMERDDVIKYNPKGVLGILSQSCLCPMKNEPYVPTPEQCEIYASIDKTRIKFIGKKKKRADSYSSGLTFKKSFYPDGLKVTPFIKEHSLQQIADIYAYICSHAISKKCPETFFKDQLSKVKYWTSVTMFPDSSFVSFPQKRPEFS